MFIFFVFFLLLLCLLLVVVMMMASAVRKFRSSICRYGAILLQFLVLVHLLFSLKQSSVPRLKMLLLPLLLLQMMMANAAMMVVVILQLIFFLLWFYLYQLALYRNYNEYLLYFIHLLIIIIFGSLIECWAVLYREYHWPKIIIIIIMTSRKKRNVSVIWLAVCDWIWCSNTIRGTFCKATWA